MKGRGHETASQAVHEPLSLGVSTNTKRNKKGVLEVQTYAPPDIANPGNLLGVKTGGGHLGWAGAHDNEAPFPEGVVEFFVKSFTRPGDIVVDFFSGSGTTASVCDRLASKAIGLDLRMSQCRLGRQRIERPHVDIMPSKKIDKPCPLFDNLEAS